MFLLSSLHFFPADVIGVGARTGRLAYCGLFFVYLRCYLVFFGEFAQLHLVVE